MRIREVQQKAENLIERGEEEKKKQLYFQSAVNDARAKFTQAEARLDYASETDEEGNPQGDVWEAQSRYYEAKIYLASCENALCEETKAIDNINKDKQQSIKEIDKYTSMEKGNMSQLKELQNKQFGGNVNGFIADLASRMNSSQEVKAKLQRSMGQSTNIQSFGEDGGGSVSFKGAEHSNSYSDDVIYYDNNSIAMNLNGDYGQYYNPQEYNTSNKVSLMDRFRGKKAGQRELSFENDNLAADKYMKREFPKKTNKDEIEAAKDYTGIAYKNLNEKLNGGLELNPYEKDLSDKLHKLIEKNVLKEDVVVYRCIGKEGIQVLLNQCKGDNDEEGILSSEMIIDLPAFTSTSLCGNNDYFRKNSDKEYVFKLTAQKGTCAVPLEDITMVSGEYELLFGRNSKIFTTGIYKGTRGDIGRDENFPNKNKEIIIIEGIIM